MPKRPKIMKILLVTNAPTPYRIPLFNVLSHLFATNNLKLKVIFLTMGYSRRKWQIPLKEIKFDYASLKSRQIRLSEEWYLFIPLNFFKILLKEKPQVIIVGGFSIATLFVFIFNLISKVPYIIWSGETGRDEFLPQKILGEMKMPNRFYISARFILRKFLIKKASAYIAYGTKAGDYLRIMGSKKPIFYGWNTTDTDYFSQNVEKLRVNRDKILRELKLSENNVHILAVGYLTPGKKYQSILEALNLIKKEENKFFLHIIGTGSEMNRLKRITELLHLKNYVIFWGYKQREEILKFYALADVLIFPSLYDIWGLVSIEAMSCGLPVIASKYAGSTYDLIQDGVNGFVVDPYNIEDMAEKTKILIENPELRKKMGENAKRTIQEKFTLEKSAQGFLEAVKYVVEKSKNKD